MALLARVPRRLMASLAAKQLVPLKKTDPLARVPVVVDGKRVFPPTVDDAGNVTYYYEFPNAWKPYSLNYTGHGWLACLQVLLWGTVYLYDQRMTSWAEKEREE